MSRKATVRIIAAADNLPINHRANAVTKVAAVGGGVAAVADAIATIAAAHAPKASKAAERSDRTTTLILAARAHARAFQRRPFCSRQDGRLFLSTSF